MDGPQLFVFRENMRKWLTKTILIPLTRDIDKANQLLVALGHTDIILGSTLRKHFVVNRIRPVQFF